MSVSFIGFDEKTLTFSTAADINPGTLVKLSGNGTVAACAADDAVFGVVISCRNCLACVQIGGYVVLPYTGTAPTVGLNTLCAGSATALEVDSTNGKEKFVLDVDTTAATCGVLL